LQQHYYHISNADPLTSAGLFVARYPWLASLFAGISMIAETAYPAALFSRRARAVLVPAVFGMQVGIRLLMGPTFNQYLICNLFWVPWARVGGAIRRRVAGTTRYSVIVDGSCGLCQRTARVVRACDLLGTVEILDLFRHWPAIEAKFPGLDRETCLANMQVLTSDGRSAEGFDGYRLLLRALPLGWLILPLLFVPGVAPIGRRAYAVVAARRASTACALPGRSGIAS
jgi:predicted DCC family thiol-disulfide oxidoreductase YuxK